MTREEVIRELKQFSGTTRLILSANFLEALNRAIKLLEQEPCEDAISRQAVIEYIKASDAELGHSSEKEIVVEDILNMPPVTLTKYIATVKFSKKDMQELINEKMKDIVVERKKGKWIPHRAKYDKTVSVYECNICHKNNGFENSKYCPNCGCQMNGE